MSEIVRYSDAELEEFRQIIIKKIEVAEMDLKHHEDGFRNDGGNGTDDTSANFKPYEDGSDSMSKEANSQLARRTHKFIVDLKHALVRIENKSYGVCRVTGKLIPKERLRLVPHATLSVEGKNLLADEKK